MKFKKVISMLCVAAILAVTCVCGVMAEDSSFTLSMAGLTSSDYNADEYTAVNNVVSLKTTNTDYIASDSIKLAKGLQVIVKVTPIVDGEIKVTYESGAVVVSADEKRGDDEAVTSDVAYAVKGGETYYLLGNSSDASKVTMITFTADEATVEPTIEPTVEPTVEPTTEPTVEPTVEPTIEPTEAPAAVLTAESGEAIVSDDTVTDGSVATGFTATVTNSGNAAGSFSKVNWTVTSNNVTKTATASSYGTITLETGADVVIGLIINGLHDAAATAVVTVE